MNLKKIFLPTPENDYTPHLLQRAAMVMMFVLVLLSFATVNLQALFWQSSTWLVGTVLPAVVVDMTNEERASLNEAPLVRNALLDQAARLKAEDMAKGSYFSHYSPTGVSPWHWFNEVNYVYATAGENLAIHFKDSGAVIDAWMKSPAHRANIVSNKYTEIGVGTAKGKYEGYDTVFVVQLFGTPAVAPVPTPTPIPTPEPVSPIVLNTETPEVAIIDKSDEFIGNEQVAGEQVVSEEVSLTPAPEAEIPKSEPAPVTPVAEPIPVEPVEVSEVLVEDNQTSVFSTHFATSSGLEPVAVGSVSGTTATEQTSFIGSIATRPTILLQAVYLTVGLLVALLLLVSIVIGIHHTRPLQIVYGIGMLMIMSGLFYVHISITTSVVIAAEPSSSEVISV